MSSLVSTVIRQDREDKASAAVHLPTGSREGQATQVPHQRGEEAVHLGNGKNGVSLDTDEPASPSHRVSKLVCVGGGGEEGRGRWEGKYLLVWLLLSYVR